MEYADVDWVMQGIRSLRNDGQVDRLYSVKEIVKASNPKEVDELFINIPATGWVTNKLYNASIIRENNILFDVEVQVNEDRLFNVEYLQHVSSLLMLPKITYNYIYMPGSLSRQNYINPSKFAAAAIAMDHLLSKGVLGENASEYCARFITKFYVRTIGCCVVYPIRILPLPERIHIGINTCKRIASSAMFKKYRWGVAKYISSTLSDYLWKGWLAIKGARM